MSACGKSEEKGSCCPSDSLPALHIGGKVSGKCIEGKGCSYYRTGNSPKTVVILYPDVWGWNSGRVRLLADHFAEQLGCTVIIPKLQPPMGKGTDGDALPPDFSINEETMPEFAKWLKGNGVKPFLKRNDALVNELKTEGFKTFFGMGCCWGGWACFKASHMFPGLFSGHLIYHPSVQVDGMYGGDPVKLASHMDCPVYFNTTNNDDMGLYDPEKGKISKVLMENKKIASKCRNTHYPDMVHGFFSRGDEKDPKVARDVTKGCKDGVAFIKSLL